MKFVSGFCVCLSLSWPTSPGMAEVGSVMGICIYKLTCPRGGEQLPYKLNPLLTIITVIYRWRVTIVYGHHQKPYTWNCNLNKQNPSPSLTPYWGRWGMTMVHNDILKKWTPSCANPFLLLYLCTPEEVRHVIDWSCGVNVSNTFSFGHL